MQSDRRASFWFQRHINHLLDRTHKERIGREEPGIEKQMWLVSRWGCLHQIKISPSWFKGSWEGIKMRPNFWRVMQYETHFYFVLSCELSKFFAKCYQKIFCITGNFSPLSPTEEANSSINKIGKTVKWIEKVLKNINHRVFLKTNCDMLRTKNLNAYKLWFTEIHSTFWTIS